MSHQMVSASNEKQTHNRALWRNVTLRVQLAPFGESVNKEYCQESCTTSWQHVLSYHSRLGGYQDEERHLRYSHIIVRCNSCQYVDVSRRLFTTVSTTIKALTNLGSQAEENQQSLTLQVKITKEYSFEAMQALQPGRIRACKDINSFGTDVHQHCAAWVTSIAYPHVDCVW